MIRRCYDDMYIEKKPTYKDCYVCDEWLNFQKFAQWFNDNYYKINNEIMSLDKDILYKNNKIYSPQTCIFVPNRINSLFTKCNSKRGSNPIGVCYDKNTDKFRADMSIINNNCKARKRYLGCYETSEEAFKVYKSEKEQYIKEIAEEYKDKIPKELYNAMYRYEVEITD